jgi:glycosyltransferase involved in cell wall biosynthesis
MTSLESQPISAIIPTVGRPELLRLCLDSLAKQTVPIAEVVVVHCGDDSETRCDEGELLA